MRRFSQPPPTRTGESVRLTASRSPTSFDRAPAQSTPPTHRPQDVLAPRPMWTDRYACASERCRGVAERSTPCCRRRSTRRPRRRSCDPLRSSPQPAHVVQLRVLDRRRVRRRPDPQLACSRPTVVSDTPNRRPTSTNERHSSTTRRRNSSGLIANRGTPADARASARWSAD